MAKKTVDVTYLPPVPFKTQFNFHSRVGKVSGDSDHVIYSSRIAEDGTVELVASGVEDTYAMIQSHKDSVDIHMILARYKNGDETALQRVQGIFADITRMPTTFAELLNTVMQGRDYFESLPVETRANFDHSFEKFIASMDNMNDFAERMGLSVQPGKENSGVSPRDGAPESVESSVSQED